MRMPLPFHTQCLILFFAAIVLLPAQALCTDGATAGSSVKEVIHLTMDNLRGHKMLYDEGWYVVTSSRHALEFAREKSVDSSGEALRRVRLDAARRSGTYAGELTGGAKEAVADSKALLKEGTALSG